MTPSSTLLGLIFAAMASPLGPAADASPCAPTQIGPHVAAQPEAWRRAVEALVTSTAAPGQPWSCVGGEVDLVIAEGSATLTVVDAAGRAITREVTSPDDIEPLGEALLAKPLPSLPEPPKAAPAPPRQTKIEAKPVPPPRMLVSASLGLRYAGPSPLVFGGATLAATLPPRPWGGSVWLRYDGVSLPLEKHASPMREVCIGAAALRGFLVGPIALRAALGPSLAVVTRAEDRGADTPDAPSDPRSPRDGETQFEFRLGAQAQMVFPILPILHGLVALDAEASPFELGRGGPRDENNDFPTYTLGLGLGVELSIP